MNTVQTKAKDRCQSVRLVKGTTDQYEWGWLVYNRRDRSQDRFMRAGLGTLEEGQAWMAAPVVGIRRRVGKSILIGG